MLEPGPRSGAQSKQRGTNLARICRQAGCGGCFPSLQGWSAWQRQRTALYRFDSVVCVLVCRALISPELAHAARFGLLSARCCSVLISVSPALVSVQCSFRFPRCSFRCSLCSDLSDRAKATNALMQDVGKVDFLSQLSSVTGASP